MLINKVEKLYGLDYDCYACGGIGNKKLAFIGQERELFTTEKEMIHRLADLKNDYTVDHIELFTTKIIKEKYSL